MPVPTTTSRSRSRSASCSRGYGRALRRSESPREPILELGDLRVDLEKRAVGLRGEPLHLTPHEYRLLALFARNEGRLLTPRMILRDVWGPAYQDELHYVHVYVSRLRRRIEDDPANPRYLLTETSAGYRFVAPER